MRFRYSKTHFNYLGNLFREYNLSMPSVNITNHIMITLEVTNLRMPAVFVTLCLLVGVISCLCTIATGIFGLSRCLHRLCCPSGCCCCAVRVPITPPVEAPEPGPNPCPVGTPRIPDTLHDSFGTLHPVGMDAPMDNAGNGSVGVDAADIADASASVHEMTAAAGATGPSRVGATDSDQDIETGIEIIDIGGEPQVYYNVSTAAGRALLQGAMRTEYEEAKEEASRYTRPSEDLLGNPLGKKKDEDK